MVEWKKLVSVANVLYGYPFESSLFSEDSNYMPLIRIRDVKPAKASTYYSGEIREEYRIKKVIFLLVWMENLILVDGMIEMAYSINEY